MHIVWFRSDLRLHDHAPLTRALELQRADGAPLLLVYCVDDRQFTMLPMGVPKTGPFRAQFLVQSLAALREAVRAKGGELTVRRGHPKQELLQLIAESGADPRQCTLHYHLEVTSEELAVEDAVVDVLATRGVQCMGEHGHTMVHRDDLPMPLDELPDVFTHYRKAVKRATPIRPPLRTPAQLACDRTVEAGDIPSLNDLGRTLPPPDPRTVYPFRGGEAAGRARLTEWIWERDRLRRYKSTRNGLVDPDDSSKLSPWLALGCLSPRLVYAEVRRYERERERSEETEWLVFELHWRDYFRWVAAAHGTRLFQLGGIRGHAHGWRRLTDAADRTVGRDWERWTTGTTGFGLVDAAMRELRATGFTSNRTRQNVASYLAKTLRIDWRLGAAWFESWLVDYDVTSNWGNWAYVAGVGNDPRPAREFNVEKQARDYDPSGGYRARWVGEVAFTPKPGYP